MKTFTTSEYGSNEQAVVEHFNANTNSVQLKENSKGDKNIVIVKDTSFQEIFKQLKLGGGFIPSEKELKDFLVENKLFNQEKEMLSLRPDFCFLDKTERTATIFEFKKPKANIMNVESEQQLLKNMYIIQAFFALQSVKENVNKHNTKEVNNGKIIGALFNGNYQRVYTMVNGIYEEVKNAGTLLENIEDYKNYIQIESNLTKNEIDREIKKINELLHFKFQMTDYYHRNMFTSALIAGLKKNINFDANNNCANWINAIETEMSNNVKNTQSFTLSIIELKKVVCNTTPSYNDKEALLKSIKILSDQNLEDVDLQTILFNEFTKYKSKSELGQVFTTAQAIDICYVLSKIDYSSKIADLCGGSGAILQHIEKQNIIAAGGYGCPEAKKIHTRIHYAEIDQRMAAIYYWGALLRGNENPDIYCGDCTSIEALKHFGEKKMDFVFMNPPYESKFRPMEIIEQTLKMVKEGGRAYYILPANKFRVNQNKFKLLLTKHTLNRVIKLPTIFQGMAATGEIMIVEIIAHHPQGNKLTKGLWIKDDGFETEKNKARVDKRWTSELKDYWTEQIWMTEYGKANDSTYVEFNPSESPEYPMIYETTPLTYNDFYKVILDRKMFENPVLAEILGLKKGGK